MPRAPRGPGPETRTVTVAAVIGPPGSCGDAVDERAGAGVEPGERLAGYEGDAAHVAHPGAVDVLEVERAEGAGKRRVGREVDQRQVLVAQDRAGRGAELRGDRH